jgi:hypothetical protein
MQRASKLRERAKPNRPRFDGTGIVKAAASPMRRWHISPLLLHRR